MRNILLLPIVMLIFAACSTRLAIQPSVSMESYRMDEEAKAMFVETNPHRASFSITPGTIADGVCTAYVKFAGLKERKEYLLFCMNTGDSHSPIAMYPLTIEDSFLIDQDSENAKNYFTLHLPAIPGFQSTWYLWSEDNALRLCQKVIPYPLKAIGADGATLTIVQKESGGNFVDIVASGLKEGEQVCIAFRSLGEVFYYPGKAPSNGTIRLPMVASFVGLQRGVMSGTTTILLVRKAETLELAFDWDLSTTQVAAKKN